MSYNYFRWNHLIYVFKLYFSVYYLTIRYIFQQGCVTIIFEFGIFCSDCCLKISVCIWFDLIMHNFLKHNSAIRVNTRALYDINKIINKSAVKYSNIVNGYFSVLHQYEHISKTTKSKVSFDAYFALCYSNQYFWLVSRTGIM